MTSQGVLKSWTAAIMGRKSASIAARGELISRRSGSGGHTSRMPFCSDKSCVEARPEVIEPAESLHDSKPFLSLFPNRLESIHSKRKPPNGGLTPLIMITDKGLFSPWFCANNAKSGSYPWAHKRGPWRAQNFNCSLFGAGGSTLVLEVPLCKLKLICLEKL